MYLSIISRQLHFKHIRVIYKILASSEQKEPTLEHDVFFLNVANYMCLHFVSITYQQKNTKHGLIIRFIKFLPITTGTL